MKIKWTILARHKWIPGTLITESCNDKGERKFTGTIHGWRNWPLGIYKDTPNDERVKIIKGIVSSIIERIEENDESVFHEIPTPQEPKS